MPHFYFIRHGQSVANSQKIIATASSPLSSLGISQAQAAATALKSKNIDLILSSPLTRAKQTAELIAESIGYEKSKIKVITELAERDFGDLKNQPKNHESPWYFTAPAGFNMETHQELTDRMKRALVLIKNLSKNSTNILIVGHAVSGEMLRLITENETEFPNAENYEQIKNAEYLELNI
jgi:broad specificity phosphatase PhoE